MESAMVPSFSFYAHMLFLAIQGTANGMVPPPNQTHSPNWQPILFGLNIYKETSTQRGYFLKCFKIVFPKNGKIFLH